jgi:hypothetical protein
MPQSQHQDRPQEITAVVQPVEEGGRATTYAVQTAIDQVVDLNRASVAAWTSALEVTWRAALDLQRTRWDAMRTLLQTTVQANQSVAQQWLAATDQVQRALLDSQATLLQTAAERRRATGQRWAELAHQEAEAAAERVLEGTVDEVDRLVREFDDPVRLDALERVERAGRQRKTVLEAIRARREALVERTSAA